jgi:hypothetical protein
MIKRIVVLLFFSTLRWTTFYIYWECSNRSYFARYTVILITSRDCNHITWFRNSASVSLLATLSHRTWVANDFSSSQLSQKRTKRLRLHFFENFLSNENFLSYSSFVREIDTQQWSKVFDVWSFNQIKWMSDQIWSWYNVSTICKYECVISSVQ